MFKCSINLQIPKTQHNCLSVTVTSRDDFAKMPLLVHSSAKGKLWCPNLT